MVSGKQSARMLCLLLSAFCLLPSASASAFCLFTLAVVDYSKSFKCNIGIYSFD